MKHDEKTSDILKLIRNIDESCTNAAYAASENSASKTNKYVYISAGFCSFLIVVLNQIKVHAPELYETIISAEMKRLEENKKES